MTDLQINIISDEEVECPEYPSPCEVGDRVVASPSSLSTENWCGGTAFGAEVSDKAERIIITRKWWDYECGWRYRCALMSPPEITATNPHYLGDGKVRDYGISEHRLLKVGDRPRLLHWVL